MWGHAACSTSRRHVEWVETLGAIPNLRAGGAGSRCWGFGVLGFFGGAYSDFMPHCFRIPPKP